jgi:hypothetical protein
LFSDYPHDKLHGTSQRGVVVPPFDWNSAVNYAELALLAESFPLAGDHNRLKRALSKAGFTYLETLFGNELSTATAAFAGEGVSLGFLALSSSNELVASIRGTMPISEWIESAAFRLVPSPIRGLAGMTEDGITAVYRSLRTDRTADSTSAVAAIKNQLTAGAAKTVTVCGHGLGGALATLLVVDVALNTSCKNPAGYTFASPRVGDYLFAHGYNAAVLASYRIVNSRDLLPQLPPIQPLPYEHVNTLYELTPPLGTIKETQSSMHHLTTYMWLMRLSGSPLKVRVS